MGNHLRLVCVCVCVCACACGCACVGIYIYALLHRRHLRIAGNSLEPPTYQTEVETHSVALVNCLGYGKNRQWDWTIRSQAPKDFSNEIHGEGSETKWRWGIYVYYLEIESSPPEMGPTRRKRFDHAPELVGLCMYIYIYVCNGSY